MPVKTKLIIGSILLALPAAVVGVIVAFLLTPLLWQMEGVLGVELAGHSGPADGVIVFTMAIFWVIFIWVFLARSRKAA